jgi:hypothetical protein
MSGAQSELEPNMSDSEAFLNGRTEPANAVVRAVQAVLAERRRILVANCSGSVSR